MSSVVQNKQQIGKPILTSLNEDDNDYFDDTKNEEEDDVNTMNIVDDERQTYILSNYSTLRTNLQWDNKIISSIIDRISAIKILPPTYQSDKTMASRQQYVLQKDKQNLSNPENDVNSSCKSIINHVQQTALRDPLLSQNNPFKQKQEEMKEEIIKVETAMAMLSEMDTEIFSDINDNNIDNKEDIDKKGVSDIPEAMLNDPCYIRLQDELQNTSWNKIQTNNNDLGYKRKRKCSNCSKEQIKKSLKFSYQVGARAFGLVDIVTDGYLLYIASQSQSLWFLTLSLTISMASPYIISYSSGVQLYLFRQTFDNVQGFKKILMFLFLLPTGILYFIFLDLADIFLHIFRWMYFVLCCKSLQEIGQTEQVLSEQLGMDRMNWEGFKRQRSVGQLMFESLPQFIFQTIIFYIFYDELVGDTLSAENQLSSTQLAISIASASINIIATSTKLKLEAKCCHSTFISYGLNCIKARVGWVPQREHILAAATLQDVNKKMRKRLKVPQQKDDIPFIDYDMHHRVCKIYKHSVEYDFSVTTLRYLMSALQMLNTPGNNEQPPLRIHFQNTLRLLPLQDIIELYSLCQRKNIQVESLTGGSKKYEYDWSSAIQISKAYGKDARLLTHGRDNTGLPYIMKLMKLSNYPSRRQIFRDLIEHDFDLNIHDLTTNESIVYTLVRSYDYKNLKYLFNYYGKNKGVLIRLNYHNKDGISPLGVALQLYEHEIYIRKNAPIPAISATATRSPMQIDLLWQILTANGAELSFPCKKNYSDKNNDGDMSPLQYALKEIRNKELARHLMAAGAQLYSKEIGLLNELFVNYELKEEKEWEETQKNKDNDDEKDEKKEFEESKSEWREDDEWREDSGFVKHEEDIQRDDSWLALLCEVATNCGRPIEFITDDAGNNPLHYFINDFNKKNKHKTTTTKMKDKENSMRLKRLKHLMFICKGSWTNEKNNDGDYPFQLIVKKRDPDLFFEFANLDDNFKQSIMERKEFVQQMIDWIIAITERITKKYPEGLKKSGKKYKDARVASDVDVLTLDKLFKVEYLGKLIKWPNKYKKVINAEEISLIGTALDRGLIEVTLYLKDYWKFPLKKSGRERLKELEDAREQKKALGIQFNRARSRLNIRGSVDGKPTGNNHINPTQFAMISPLLRGKSEIDREDHRKRTGTRDSLKLAPAPVLRQITLPPKGGLGGGLFDGTGLGDVDMLGILDRIQSAKVPEVLKHGEKSKIETIYSFFVEALSTADFITDILVVWALIKEEQTWSISFMLLFMISPYLVSHSIMCSLIDSRRQSYKLDMLSNKVTCCKKCGYRLINTLALILMTPLAIVWFTFVDVTFMIYLIISTIFFLFTCGKIDISDKMDDLLFKKCLGMSRMQIIGYRRLRTLSQLLFETLPQIALQGWILYESVNNVNSGFHINASEIYISIGVAAIHVILELFIIYLDARASQMSLIHYGVICLGARLNWVPFAHQIRRGKDETRDRGYTPRYNFECIEFKPWFFAIFGDQKYRIEYEFSPSSIKKLGEYFINLPVIASTDAPSNPYLAPVWLFYYKHNTLPVIYLGKTCCRSLDVYAFAEFFRSADKKVILKSAQLDWTRIIFQNTPNTSSDNVYLKRLCEEFINYAEIKLITQLAPVVNLNTTDVLLYILRMSSHNLLLILKKYYNENIHFGLNVEIMQLIYNLIVKNKWIKNYRADPSYAKVVFLLMWYTRRTIHRHQDPRGDLKFIHDKSRSEFLEKAIECELPLTFIISYDSDATNKDMWNRKNSDDQINKIKTILNTGKIRMATIAETNDKLISEDSKQDDTENKSESDYQIAADWYEPQTNTGTYAINLADDDDYHEVPINVEFEILECFKYFQPQIENYLLEITGKRNISNIFKIGDKSLFKFFKKVFNKETTDFLKLIINSPWNVLQQFPIHVRFAELFARLDPVVRRLEMVHGFGKYLLASSRYRQSNKAKPMTFLVDMDYDNFRIKDNGRDIPTENLLNSYENHESNQILNIQTDPAYHGHTSLRSASYGGINLEDQMGATIELSGKPRRQINKKYMYDKSDIMGIARIEIEFVGLEVKENGIFIDEEDSDDDDDNDNNDEKSKSLGKVQLFTILPQKTKILNDKLMLNKVVLKEMTFEEIMDTKDKKLIIDLYDNEVLGMYRPIYVGRDKIDLMPLKVSIVPSHSSTQITCNQIEARITYLLRRLVDATAMKFESVAHRACSLQNLEFLQFIYEYQDVFDCNAVDDHYQNALHILCGMDDPDLEIFSLSLQLSDIDVNQIRFDGKTPFKLLEDNYNIDVEKKDEMLKQIAAMPSYRPIHHEKRRKRKKKKSVNFKDEDNADNDDKCSIKNVLLIGSNHSGRHSLLKQLQIHYQKRHFSPWEKSVERSKIIKFMISSMKILIKHCGDDKIATLSDNNAAHIYSIKSDNLQTIEHLPSESFIALQKLWNNKAIKRVYYENGEELDLSDSVAYFFYRIQIIKQINYSPNELDILRAPHQIDKTILTSKSYRLDDEASDLQIRWIVPKSYKILSSSNLYAPTTNIDTIIFMVSLTSFMETDSYKNNDNNFIKSLKLFKKYCHDKRFNKTKFVLLFNKTDIFQKKIGDKNEILQDVININNDDNDDNDDEMNEIIDSCDYWDWLDLVQAMFRLQHPNRTVFSYPLSAADPAKVRSILKELEDIILQSNIPTISNMAVYKKKALLTVKWIAILNQSINKENNLPQYLFDLSSVSIDRMQQIANNKDININYNAMLYKTVQKDKQKKNKEKIVSFLISIDNDTKNAGFVWSKWKKSKRIPTYPQSKGYWQLIDCNELNDNNCLNDFHLNGILAILHHKELRTQFDGFTINRNPITIRFMSDDDNNIISKSYKISWWNMARMSKCNAITVDDIHYLHLKSPLKDSNIQWNWYDNDAGESREYDDECIVQLECSYQANLESNFPIQIASNSINSEEEEEEKYNKNNNNNNNNKNMEDRIFNHCVLTDLMKYMEEKHGANDPNYILRFGFNQQNQISHMTQLRIYPNKNNFARDVQRRYNGRNSAWPI